MAITLTTGEVVHDFTRTNLRWGRNILSLRKTGEHDGEIVGIGTGIKAGEYIWVQEPDDRQCFRVESIKYETNPKDFFSAKVSGMYVFEQDQLPNG